MSYPDHRGLGEAREARRRRGGVSPPAGEGAVPSPENLDLEIVKFGGFYGTKVEKVVITD